MTKATFVSSKHLIRQIADKVIHLRRVFLSQVSISHLLERRTGSLLKGQLVRLTDRGYSKPPLYLGKTHLLEEKIGENFTVLMSKITPSEIKKQLTNFKILIFFLALEARTQTKEGMHIARRFTGLQNRRAMRSANVVSISI